MAEIVDISTTGDGQRRFVHTESRQAFFVEIGLTLTGQLEPNVPVGGVLKRLIKAATM
jgi:hypothetical protein